MPTLKKLFKFFTISSLLGLFVIIGSYLYLKSELPSVDSLKNLQWQTPMQIFSADDKLISQFGEKKRIPLSLEEIPQDLINAILATEDDRFYLHFGVDPIGMGRAVLGQIMGQNKGGASTITMQVARNFFGSTEQTYIRKLREIYTAFHIEYLLSKDEILSLYLNKIPLGHRAFGFGAAAQVYYGKEINELTLPQIAVLAGLPKAPSTLNPIRSPKRAKARRSVVLQRMLVSGYITQQQYNEANSAPITGKKHGAEIELNAPYIAEMAHQKMLKIYGREEAYTAGYKVYTTVPSHLQIAAKNAVVKNIFNYDMRHGYRGPLFSLIQESNEEEQTSETVNSDTESHEVIENDIANLLNEETISTIKNVKTYAPLQVALVTEVHEKSVAILIFTPKNSMLSAEISWEGLSWARPYINDDKQGPAPENSQDILSAGDVIYVKKTNDSYALSQLPDVSSALIAISPDNGAIQAAIGGFNYQESQFNRATQAKRQFGSNIKPFLYSAALNSGFTLASIVNDAPINQWDASAGRHWRPTNSPPRYNGPIRIRLALAQSKNVVAVRLLREVGLSKIVDHLVNFGFKEQDLPRVESLALGAASVTPLEAVTGFATFANSGFLVEPYIIERIEDSFGNIIYQADPLTACSPCNIDEDEISENELAKNTRDDEFTFSPDLEFTADGEAIITSTEPVDGEQEATEKQVRQAPQIITPQNAFLISQALNSVIWGGDWQVKPFWNGTGWRAQKLKRRDIAGKTGTTNESKDAWFSGFSRRIAVSTWIGFDDPSRNLGQASKNKNITIKQTTGKESGATSAQPAWNDFMSIALQSLPVEPFEQPEGLVTVRIDKATGKLTNKTDNTSTLEYFIEGSAPKNFVTQDTSTGILDGEPNNAEDIF